MSNVRDAIRYWEPRRLWYNVALTALCAWWVVHTWPHFAPALTLANLRRMLVLGVLANACYSSAYLVDLTLQASASAAVWRRWRWLLWVAGMVLALLLATYWIGDEIYPSASAA